jgi:hypothetical protein
MSETNSHEKPWIVVVGGFLSAGICAPLELLTKCVESLNRTFAK